MAGEKLIKVKKSEWKDILGEHEERGGEIKKLQHQVKACERENTKLHKDNDALSKDNSVLKKKLKNAIEELQAERGARKRKSTKHLQKEDVNAAIHIQVREFTSRNVKFAQPGKEIEDVTKTIWHQIKDAQKLDQGDKPLDEKKFCFIYTSVVQAELSIARQYVQSRGQQAARGTKNLA